MNNLILIFFSGIDSGIRFIGTFIYQTNASYGNVAEIYKFIVYSNFACIPFLLLIPITYRFAHFANLKKPVETIYKKLILYLFIFFALTSLIFFIFDSETKGYAILNGFLLGFFGSLVSILNILGKLYFLQVLKACLGCLVAAALFSGLIFNLNSFTIIQLMILSVIGCSCAALSVIKLNHKITFNILKLFSWLKVGLYKYRGPIMNTGLLILYVNIDRLIVSNISNEVFLSQYAISTTLCAPIIVISNVFQLRYWPKFAKKNSSENYGQYLYFLVLMSLSMGIACFLVYFSIKNLNIFSSRIPEINSYVLVLFYYMCYPVVQFNSFYFALKRPSFIKTGVIGVCLVLAFFLTKDLSSLYAALPLLSILYVLVPAVDFSQKKNLINKILQRLNHIKRQ